MDVATADVVEGLTAEETTDAIIQAIMLQEAIKLAFESIQEEGQ